MFIYVSRTIAVLYACIGWCLYERKVKSVYHTCISCDKTIAVHISSDVYVKRFGVCIHHACDMTVTVYMHVIY